MKSIQQSSPFDHIRQVENGREYWSARDLQKLLGYTQWRRFEDAIDRAKHACKNSGQNPNDHFADVGKPIKSGKGRVQEAKDYHLTRYAAYLVAMNGDPRKEEIANTQAYFMVKTREAEIMPRQPLINSLWEERLDLFHKHTKLPPDYWSIFGIVAGYCRADEFRNVHLVENALPDGSVGKRWKQYIEASPDNYDLSLIKKYDHIYPDHRGKRPAKTYPTIWLGDFWEWFNGCYLKEYYPEYVRTHSIDTGKYIEAPRRVIALPDDFDFADIPYIDFSR